MASIYILFPHEHLDLKPHALQHFQWAVERFQAMSDRNPLAKAALGVLHAIYLRLKKSLGISSQGARALPSSSTTSPASGNISGSTSTSANSTAPSLWDTPSTATIGDFSPPPQQSQSHPTPPQPHQTDANLNPNLHGNLNGNLNLNLNLDPSLFPSPNPNPAADITDLDWTQPIPSNFDWASLQPIYATSDLFYHDLVGVGAAHTHGGGGGGDGGLGWDQSFGQSQGQGQGHYKNMSAIGGLMSGNTGGVGAGGMDTALGVCAETGEVCHFAGDFADDSVWSLFNQFAPL